MAEMTVGTEGVGLIFPIEEHGCNDGQQFLRRHRSVFQPVKPAVYALMWCRVVPLPHAARTAAIDQLGSAPDGFGYRRVVLVLLDVARSVLEVGRQLLDAD